VRQAEFPPFNRLPDYHTLELYTVALRSSKLNRSGSKANPFGGFTCGTDEKLQQLRCWSCGAALRRRKRDGIDAAAGNGGLVRRRLRRGASRIELT
jgi:hypothetical protein